MHHGGHRGSSSKHRHAKHAGVIFFVIILGGWVGWCEIVWVYSSVILWVSCKIEFCPVWSEKLAHPKRTLNNQFSVGPFADDVCIVSE